MYKQLELPLTVGKLTREQRLNQIIDILQNTQFVTVGQVAAMLGIKKTPYLRDMLGQIVLAGFATVQAVETGRPLPTYVYSWTQQTPE